MGAKKKLSPLRWRKRFGSKLEQGQAGEIWKRELWRLSKHMNKRSGPTYVCRRLILAVVKLAHSVVPVKGVLDKRKSDAQNFAWKYGQLHDFHCNQHNFLSICLV